MNRHILQKEIVADEGMVLHVYKDHLGYPTVGCGHLITEKDEEFNKPEGYKISSDRANTLFATDLENAIDDCRKLYSGTIVKIDPTNVPRVIGKQGSMITAIRENTQTRIQIGQNGYIWIDGKGEDIALAQKAIETIDQEATSKGLTKKIEKLLEK